MDDMERQAQQREAELLAQIGSCMFAQDLRVKVCLPVALAASAIAAWERDDLSNTDTNTETQGARTVRSQAGALALIGLAVDERGVPNENDQVEVELEAWQIGTALDAADQRGLLAGLTLPDRNG